MHLLEFHHWFNQFESYGAGILVAIGAALLIASGIGATGSPLRKRTKCFAGECSRDHTSCSICPDHNSQDSGFKCC